MKPLQICWLPGWASNLELWSSEIEERFPDAQHHFVDYAELMAHSKDLRLIPQVVQCDLIVAWSLGSLITLQNLAQWNESRTCVLISPIAWFCHPELGWPMRVLRRMSEKLRQDPQAILQAFAEKMQPMDPWQATRWVEQALTYSPELLASGLDYLATQSAPHLDQVARRHSIHLVAGSEDQIVSPELSIWLEREIQPRSMQVSRRLGHFPFPLDWSIPLDAFLPLAE